MIARRKSEKPARRKYLVTAVDIRRLLSQIISDVRLDKITNDKARCVGYLCTVFLKSVEASDFESRLTALETILAEVKHGEIKD